MSVLGGAQGWGLPGSEGLVPGLLSHPSSFPLPTPQPGGREWVSGRRALDPPSLDPLGPSFVLQTPNLLPGTLSPHLRP